MYIGSIVVRNWANLPDKVYHPGMLTLITGSNGSGKTTLADAVQTVMSAAYHNLFQYNPGQDEVKHGSRKKTKRTLANYALGCDEGPYARPDGADTFIGVNFTLSQGEKGREFCAVVAVRARLNNEGNKQRAEEERLELLIIRDRHMGIEDFKHKADGQENWLEVDSRLVSRLAAAIPKDQIDAFGSKKDQYLGRLYALLRGSERKFLNPDEAKKMVKAWTKFMAYKPVNDVDTFVRDNILEAWDSSSTVNKVSSLIRTITEMKRTASHIENAIGVIEAAKGHCNDLLQRWLAFHENKALAAHAQFVLNDRQYREMRDAEEVLKRDIAAFNASIENSQAERDSLDQQRVAVEAKLQGFAEYQQKSQLETEIEKNERELREKLVSVVAAQDRISVVSSRC